VKKRKQSRWRSGDEPNASPSVNECIDTSIGGKSPGMLLALECTLRTRASFWARRSTAAAVQGNEFAMGNVRFPGVVSYGNLVTFK